jgi:hypothetical protein
VPLGLQPSAWLDELQAAEESEERAFVAKIAAIVSFSAAKAARPNLKLKRFRWLRRICIFDEFSGLAPAERAALFGTTAQALENLRAKGDYRVVKMLVKRAGEALAPGAMMDVAPKLEGAMVEREVEVGLTGKGRDARAARAEVLDRLSAKKGRDPKEALVMRLPADMEKRMRELEELSDAYRRARAMRGEIVDPLPDHESSDIDAARVLPAKAGDA